MQKNIYKPLICFLVLMTLSHLSDAAELEKAFGAELFKRCAACHLKSAQGVQGMFPPLVHRLGNVASSDAGRDYLVLVTDSGLSGTMTVDGIRYTGLMPGQGPSLGDAGVASVLNYLLSNFNAETLPDDWQPFSEKEIVAIKKRYPSINNQEKQRLRQQLMKAL